MSARLANIDADCSPGGYRNNFEPTAAYDIEVDPVEARQSTKKAVSFDSSANNSSVNVSGASIGNQGLLGVYYQWYKHDEDKALFDSLKEDLAKWRATPEGKTATKKANKVYYDSIQKAKVSS